MAKTAVKNKSKHWAPVPRITSKTITGGALLRKIKALILARPLRLNMNKYVSAFAGATIHAHQVDDMPSCGTVACMAGWAAVILRPDGVSGRKLDRRAGDVMTDLLGFEKVDYDMPYQSVGGLFDPDFVEGMDDADGLEWEWPTPGTRAHAVLVAKRIDTYLSQHPEVVDRKIVVADARAALAKRVRVL